MKIHEYQAKEILRQFNIPTPIGKLAFSVKEAVEHSQTLLPPVVVKAQIHAGGRGKGGGVKFSKTLKEAEKNAENILGKNLITYQTKKEGQLVKKLLIEKAVNIKHEFYAGMVLDRSSSKITFMVSSEGGVEIEKIAENSPEKIIKEQIDPLLGILPYQARNLAFSLNLKGDVFKNAVRFFLKLYHLYIQTDASLVEINPLVVMQEDEVIALDAKINFDDNSLFRQKNIHALQDLDEEEPTEIEAAKYNMSYIKLDGNIGCMVNGAGLAMATMDIIKLAGEKPANFLDIGGKASADTIEKGFNIILSDKNVKAVLINVFGGIVRCDRVANGVIQAIKNIDVNIPIVVRLQGTNADIAKDILNSSEMNIMGATELNEAAQKVVNTLKK